MKMDFKKFKKISSDSKSTTLKHPEGHKIVIAHHALSPAMKKQLAEIPTKYAEGGGVDGGDDGRAPASLLNPEDAQAASARKFGSGMTKAVQDMAAIKAQEGPVSGDPEYGPINRTSTTLNQPTSDKQDALALEQWQKGLDSPPTTGSAPVSRMPAYATPEQLSDPYGTAQYGKEIRGAVGQLAGAADAEAKAKGDLGNRQADILAQQQVETQKIQADGQARFAHYMDEADKVAKDALSGHINPNHYVESMSTFQRVATAIGLILGGAGSAVAGQENMAGKFLQQQIERDVEAQKANLSHQDTLMSHFLRQGESVQNATNLSRAFTANIYATRLEAEAAKAQSPLAAASAKKEAAQIRLQYAPLLQSTAMKSAALSAVRGDGNVQDPSALVQFLVPEHHQKAVFDEIERAQDTKRMGSSILDSFDQAAKDNTVLKTGAGMLRTPGSVLALHQSMQPTFKDLEGTVRQAAMDNTFKNITPAPGDMDSTIKTKRAALVDYLKSKASAPTAKGFGIDLDKFSSTKPPVNANPLEGQTARNAQGQRIIMKGGRWIPYGG